MRPHRFTAMGGPCELRLYGARADQVAQQAEEEVRRLERKYSRYRDDSLATRINRSAGDAIGLEVDAETAGLLDYARTAWEQSGGLFDPTAGVLRAAWDFKQARVPLQDEIARLLPRVGWQKIRWHHPRLTLPAGMELDFGGLVKEYAADSAAALCRAAGIEHGLVELGGDLVALGPHPDGSAWRVGIQHPREPGRAIASVELARGALATSGDYERGFERDGRRYHHILDPRTGWPTQGLASVSVIGDRCLIAGTASTIGMLKGAADGPRWLVELALPYLCVDSAGALHGGLARRELQP